jgi:hypothetical protein
MDAWQRAVIDYRVWRDYSFKLPDKTIALFKLIWKYLPGDKPSYGKGEWWVGLASDGAIVGYGYGYGYGGEGYNGFKYNPNEDDIYCSGQVKRIPITSLPFPRITFPENSLEIKEVYVCTKTNVVKDNKAKQAAPKSNLKAKKVTRAGCNKGSSVTSPSTGGAQGALKKFGTGTDGCAQ